MAKVYATVQGAKIEIGQYGYATTGGPAEVPDRIGRGLEGHPELRVEFLPAATEAAAQESSTVYPRRRR